MVMMMVAVKMIMPNDDYDYDFMVAVDKSHYK